MKTAMHHPLVVGSEPRPEKSAATAPLHLGLLDGMRALAALYVLLHHAVSEVWPDQHALRGLPLLLVGPFRYGHFAVGVFIVLSGFCLMLPVTRHGGTLNGGAVRFFLKRSRRILPTYYAALIVSLVLASTLIASKTGTIWDVAIPLTWRGICSHLLMYHDVVDAHQINYAYWSIAVEWRIYFLFPIIVLIFRAWGPGRTMLAVLAATVGLFIAVRRSPLSGTMPVYLALFCFGALAAEIAFGQNSFRSAQRTRVSWLTVSAIAFASLLALLIKWRADFNEERLFVLDLLNGLWVGSLLVVVTGPHLGLAGRICSWPPLVFVGTFAYSIYLLHGPLLQLIWQYALRPLHLSSVESYFLMFLAGVPAILGASYLFFLLFERPFLTARKAQPAPRLEKVPNSSGDALAAAT